MSETEKPNPCVRLDRWLTAYVDDELDAVHALETEDHLAACEPCRERVALDRAIRGSLRGTRPKASEALRRRAAAALLAEHTVRAAETTERAQGAEAEPPTDAGSAEPRASEQPSHRPKLVRLRYVAPLAVAASIALFAGGRFLPARHEAATGREGPHGAPQATAQMANTFDRFIDDLIDAHMQPPPPEVTDDDGLTRLNPFVGVRVSRPELTAVGARFLGARMHHRQAAMLQYALGDRRRVSLYVFDPARVPVQASRLERRVVDNRNLYLGHVRGFTVAASERDGVGYALASDLSDQETEKVIVMAAR